ncbi:MAG: undecaprenyl-diphosphatase [Chloroflexota bacterium]|nr:undecaprenyl-diphosphatase [Chloroflexota bacterium]
MTFFQSILLGIVQGITEFLPISSSAHLVLVPALLNWHIPTEQLFPFDVLVQLGTLVAVIVYYREDLATIIRSMGKGLIARKPFAEVEARTGWLTLLATIPAGLVGLLVKPYIESAFNSPAVTSISLFITAAFLVASEVLGKRTREIDALTWKDALWVGLFQAFSVFPGISRSGSTITGAMMRNFKRRTAGQFAFLMAIPIMLAAGLLGVLDMLKIPNLQNFLPVMVTGFLIAGIVGYFSISWLIRYINNHSLVPFAVYCALLGAGSLALMAMAPQPADLNNAAAAGDSSAYQIAYNPNLEWLVPDMNACQAQQDDFQISYQRAASLNSASGTFDAYLYYGSTNEIGANLYQLGSDTIVAAVNSGRGMQSIRAEMIDDIFSGRTTTWGGVYQACPDCFSSDLGANNDPIAIWMLPEESNLWNTFAASYLSSPVSSFAQIAPNAGVLRQMLASDAGAIGILPAGWLDTSVNGLTLQVEGDAPVSLPILTATHGQPDEALSQWLTCLQGSMP